MKKLSKNEWVAVVISVFIVGFFFIFGQGLVSLLTKSNNVVQTSQLSTQDVTYGAGEQAKVGSRVVVHYTGKFTDGTVFDSSVSRNEPFPFVLGDDRLIKGWNEGIEGMRVGGKRIITVPPEYGYGSQQNGPIPPNSTLIFEVELLKVESAQ